MENKDWIDINSQNPDKYTFVLATLKSSTATWVEIVGYGVGRFQLPGRGDTNYVTHWMPIPRPFNCR